MNKKKRQLRLINNWSLPTKLLHQIHSSH